MKLPFGAEIILTWWGEPQPPSSAYLRSIRCFGCGFFHYVYWTGREFIQTSSTISLHCGVTVSVSCRWPLDESEVVRYVLQIICDLFLRSNIMFLNCRQVFFYRYLIINGFHICVILNFFIAVGIDYRKTTKKRRIRRFLQILLQKYIQIAILWKLFTEKCVSIWMQVLRY